MPNGKMYEIINDPKKLGKYKDFNVYTKRGGVYKLLKPSKLDFDYDMLSVLKDGCQLFILMSDRSRLIQKEQFCLHQDLKKSLNVDIPKSRELIRKLVKVTLSEPRSGSLKSITEAINIIVDEYLKNPEVVIQLTHVCVHDYSTQLHLTNAMLLCLGYARCQKYSKEEMKFLGLMGLLHDVGKVEIPDYLLQAPRQLTAEEFNYIKWHPVAGMKMLKDSHFEEDIQRVALEHHERLDGSGYPSGKKGSELSEASKILSIIDIFEALTTWRPYKVSFSPLEALKIIKRDVDNGKLDKDCFEKFAYSIIGMSSSQEEEF